MKDNRIKFHDMWLQYVDASPINCAKTRSSLVFRFSRHHVDVGVDGGNGLVFFPLVL